MVFKLNCQVINKIDDSFRKNLLLLENKENQSCYNSPSYCSKEVLELVGDGVTARYKIMQKYNELITAIKYYEEVTNNLNIKVSESWSKNSDAVKPNAEYIGKIEPPRNIDNQNVRIKTLGESLDCISNPQDSKHLGHFESYTSKESEEYILASFSIPQPPELNFNY